MLQALQNHLRQLASQDNDKFREEITARFKTKATDEQVQAIKDFIFLMPPTLKVLSQYWNDKKTPANVRNIARMIIAYVFHPQDLLSEEKHGLFGYLDDSYLVVSTFLKIQDMYIRNWDEKSELERDLIERAKTLINVPRLVIPEITDKIESTIEDWLKGKVVL